MTTFSLGIILIVSSGCGVETNMKNEGFWQMWALSRGSRVSSRVVVAMAFNRYTRWNRYQICESNDWSSRLPASTNIVSNDFKIVELCVLHQDTVMVNILLQL
ncbi:hypothetical protein CDAR_484891 [Caerostris darwini]|uniref:Secreted protein n=1 Tax=Caerostris darwini TaxID=1538125 RepID=A0AAV4PD89_9ARAC|nr:hypothetical protein CDAR_484891 [Caerostris darwini]